MNKSNVFLGTELKLNIHIDPITSSSGTSTSMCDYEFQVEVFCSPRNMITILKKDAICVDKDNYVVLIDTDKLGMGSVKCRVTAYLEDTDADDDLRTEVVVVDTGINVVKGF